jgi:hypothetical protein
MKIFKKVWQFILPQKEDTKKIQFDLDRKNISFGTIFMGIILGGFLLGQTESSLFEVHQFVDKPHCPLDRCSELQVDSSDRWFYQNQEGRTYQKFRGDVREVSTFDLYPGLEIPYEKAKQAYAPLAVVQGRIQNLEGQKQSLERVKNDHRSDYQTRILENISGRESGVFNNGTEVEQKIDQTFAQIQALENKIVGKKRNEQDLLKVYKKAFTPLQKAHMTALKKYQADKHIFDVKVFLLQFLITLPLFLIGHVWYRKSKAKNSKYSILPLILLIVGGITFLQVLMMYASSWIPFEFFGKLLEWLADLPFGRLLIHYLFVFLGIAVFGALIINIQRRLFSEKRIALKRLHKKECPFCAFPLLFSDKFCSGCGEELRIKCSHCETSTLKVLANCQGCGKNPKTP